MDAYATAGVFRRVPHAFSSGIGSRSSHHAKIPFSVGRKWLVSGFTDEGHLGYYSTSRRRIRCEVESETMRRDDKVKDKKRKKMLKKRSKLLKNLSKDLSTLTQIGFGLDCSNPCDLIDQDQEKKISEAAEALLAQLQKLRANECEDSSSSSSESSDSECEGVANMNKMKPKPVAEKAPLMLSRAANEPSRARAWGGSSSSSFGRVMLELELDRARTSMLELELGSSRAARVELEQLDCSSSISSSISSSRAGSISSSKSRSNFQLEFYA